MLKDYRDSHLIYFGDKAEAVSLKDIKESRFSLIIQNLAHDHGLSTVVVLDQVHGIQGCVVDQKFLKTNSGWFGVVGDFLITAEKNIGLIILTADCIPLVLYDSKNHVIAAVHAGWKGSYEGVVQKTLQMMQEQYQTNVGDLICTFGPSARICCYEVSDQFKQDFDAKYFMPEFFVPVGQKWHFDNNLFLQAVLKKFGIQQQNLYTNNAVCTMCNTEFCSFRKEKELAKRQITMVALR